MADRLRAKRVIGFERTRRSASSEPGDRLQRNTHPVSLDHKSQVSGSQRDRSVRRVQLLRNVGKLGDPTVQQIVPNFGERAELGLVGFASGWRVFVGEAPEPL